MGSQPKSQGFTLLELLVVVTLVALGSALVSLSFRDPGVADLERDAARLGAWLEGARAYSRSTGQTVRWRATDDGFRFEGWPTQRDNVRWLGEATQAEVSHPLTLGPEPIIPAQSVRLSLRHDPKVAVSLSSDGLRPFSIGSTP